MGGGGVISVCSLKCSTIFGLRSTINIGCYLSNKWARDVIPIADVFLRDHFLDERVFPWQIVSFFVSSVSSPLRLPSLTTGQTKNLNIPRWGKQMLRCRWNIFTHNKNERWLIESQIIGWPHLHLSQLVLVIQLSMYETSGEDLTKVNSYSSYR